MTDKSFEVKKALIVNTNAFTVDPLGIINAAINVSSGNSTVNVFVDKVNGRIGIDKANPGVSLDARNKTDAIAFPVGNTGQRPTVANGMVRYNNETNGFEGYRSGSWSSISGGGIESGDVFFTEREPSSGWLRVDTDQTLLQASYPGLYSAVGLIFDPAAAPNTFGMYSPLDFYADRTLWCKANEIIFTSSYDFPFYWWSNNAFDWNNVTYPDSKMTFPHEVAYGNGVYILVGSQFASNSSFCSIFKGTTPGGLAAFSDFTNPTYAGNVYSIAYGNNTWIAVGTTSGAATYRFFKSTDDGATWSNTLGPGSGGVQLNQVVYDGMGTFYAIASGFSSNSTTGGVYRSTDNGTNWTMVLNPANVAGQTTNTFMPQAIGVGTNGQVVVVGNTLTNEETLRCWSANQAGSWSIISNVISSGVNGQIKTGHEATRHWLGQGAKLIEYVPANATFLIATYRLDGTGSDNDFYIQNINNNAFRSVTWANSLCLSNGNTTGELYKPWRSSPIFLFSQNLIHTVLETNIASSSQSFHVFSRDANNFWRAPDFSTNTSARFLVLDDQIVSFSHSMVVNNTTNSMMVIVCNSATGNEATWQYVSDFSIQFQSGADGGANNGGVLLGVSHDGTNRTIVTCANINTSDERFLTVYYSNNLTTWTQSTMPGSGGGEARVVLPDVPSTGLFYQRDIFTKQMPVWLEDDSMFIVPCRFEANSTGGVNAPAVVVGNGSHFSIVRGTGNNYIAGYAAHANDAVIYYIGVVSPTSTSFSANDSVANLVYANSTSFTITNIDGQLCSTWTSNTINTTFGSNVHTWLIVGGGYVLNWGPVDLSFVTFEEAGLPNSAANCWPIIRIGKSWVLSSNEGIYVSKTGTYWSLQELQANNGNTAHLTKVGETIYKGDFSLGSSNGHILEYSYDTATQFYLNKIIHPINEMLFPWVKT
jgi:hypothetical protein